MGSQTKTKVRELSRAFIKGLNEQNFSATEFGYVEMGPASEDGDLQRLEITATANGWLLYTRFKESWIVK